MHADLSLVSALKLTYTHCIHSTNQAEFTDMNIDSYFYAIAVSVHALAAVIWVGGMFFAYVSLRPVAARLLEPPQRLDLWAQTLKNYFIWVGLAIIILPATGYWIIFSVYNGFAGVGWTIHLMHTLGLIMILIFLHVYFAPFKRLRRAVEEENFQEGAKNLAIIRKMVGINLMIGIATFITAIGLAHIPL